MAFGSKGVRLGFQGLNSTAFSVDALMTKADYSQESEKQEFKNPDTGAIVFVNYVTGPEKATFAYIVGSSTLTVSASIVMPEVGAKFEVAETGEDSDLTSTTWICDKRSFSEVPATDGATEVTIEATNYGF